jgi:hypothetical protein
MYNDIIYGCLYSWILQLDLLCAQWGDKIEDGGQDALAQRDDWANCEAPPVVSDIAADIVRQMAHSDGMEQTRSALAWGKLMQPQFSPSKVTDSAFCETWRSDKV